jgi:hypothetical protein
VSAVADLDGDNPRLGIQKRALCTARGAYSAFLIGLPIKVTFYRVGVGFLSTHTHTQKIMKLSCIHCLLSQMTNIIEK